MMITAPRFRSRLLLTRTSLCLVLICAVSPMLAQDPESQENASSALTENSSPLQYVAPKTIEMVIGLRLTSGDGNMSNTIATTVFPTGWPEQKVEVIEVNIPTLFRHDFRELPGDNRQLVLFSPVIPARSTIEATVKVRIEKSHTLGPTETSELVVPKRLPRDASDYLKDSPYIEVRSSEIRKIVRDIEETNPDSDWAKIELLYDWVRDNIQYEHGELKTVRDALRDKSGDCEEMTSTFVALCRAARVPARCVWIPNHCYPEFYMQDKEGNGYWFPCQVAGTRNFGSMPEYLPILQKGDRFKVPEKPELQRYLADFLASQKVFGKEKPKVEFIRQLLGDAASLPTPDLDGAANP